MMLKKSRILFYMTRYQIRLKSTEASAKDLVLFSNKNNVTTITLNNPGYYKCLSLHVGIIEVDKNKQPQQAQSG